MADHPTGTHPGPLDRARAWVGANQVLTGILAVLVTILVTGLVHIATGG